MPRPMSDDLLIPWKITLPATLSGRVEFMLTDPIHQKPIYGARAKLITALLEWWIARETGKPETPVPSLVELRTQGDL